MENIERREIEVVIYEKKFEEKYSPDGAWYVGKTQVCTWGYDYNYRNRNKNYIIETNLVNIKDEYKFYETLEEARNFAYKVTELFLKNLSHGAQ